MESKHKKTKIISRVENYELDMDTRSLESFFSINLELSLHEKDENPIIVSNLENWLSCIIDPNKEGWDFQPKPLTLWRRFPAEPGKLQFLADIREACAKSDSYNEHGMKIGKIPLPNLNEIFPVHSRDDDPETFETDTYDYLQLRFDVYPGDLDLHSKVDLNDFSHLARDWGRQGEPREFIGDITGPLGLPDGNVDFRDLELLTRYWLKDIREIMPSP